MPDGREKSDLIEDIRDGFLTHLLDLDSLESIDLAIRLALNFVDTRERSLSDGFKDVEVLERGHGLGDV